ncbi:MAG: sporulation transcriptional regulator SpoIIID [Clostridia bacterium]|nr:sporulation transcriptional regulator SpoIIID [Clostridia bacterium]
MRPSANERAVILGEHIVQTGETVRKAAAQFGVSKSTVHKDVTERLKKINPPLYREVDIILKKNKEERHLRGGEATKQKYIRLQTKKSDITSPVPSSIDGKR